MVDTHLPIANRPRGSRLIRVPKDVPDIQDALDLSATGDCVLISSGHYELLEPLVINRDVHLMGDEDGAPSGVVLRRRRGRGGLGRADYHMLTVEAPSCHLTHLTFTHADPVREEDPEGEAVPASALVFCVFLKEGNVLIDRCRFHSDFASGVGVGPLARPTLSHCRFVVKEYGVFACRDSLTRVRHAHCEECGTGVFLDEGAKGVVEDSEFRRCGIGLEVTLRCDPRVWANKFIDCESGLFVSSGLATSEGAQVEANEFTGNGIGVKVAHNGHPRLVKNTIVASKDAGVSIMEGGGAHVQLCDIQGNKVGVRVGHRSHPTLLKNTIRDNAVCGVEVKGGEAYGIIKDNDITGNGVGVEVADGGCPTLAENRIARNLGAGVTLTGSGSTTIKRNEITLNEGDGVVVRGGMATSASLLTENSIGKNTGRGVAIQADGAVNCSLNVVEENGLVGIEISGCAAGEGPLVSENDVRGHTREGVLVHLASTARLHENQVMDNGRHDVYVTHDSSVVDVKL